jgi:hypothetical protein
MGRYTLKYVDTGGDLTGHVSIRMDVFISNEQSPYFKQDGRVLSIYSDYGLESPVVNIQVRF